VFSRMMSSMLLKVVALLDNVPSASGAGAADATEKNAAATGRASILEKIIVQELDGRRKIWPIDRRFLFCRVFIHKAMQEKNERVHVFLILC
jgi:hypothetical protein